MRTLALSARKRIKNKFIIKIQIQNPVNCMVKQPVPDSCFMNIARFWVIYFESIIWAMFIRFFGKLAMERKNIIHKMDGKLINIFSFFLITQKFAPCGKQIFYRNDIIVDMIKTSSSLSLSAMLRFSTASKRDIWFGWISSLIFLKERAIQLARGLKINFLIFWNSHISLILAQKTRKQKKFLSAYWFWMCLNSWFP